MTFEELRITFQSDEQMARAQRQPRQRGKLMEHALPRRTAATPRTWSLCMTSENHGTVGKAGDQFSHAPGKHERVQVVEIVAAGSPPAPGVDLSGLMRFGFCDINDDEFIERPDGDYFLVPQVEARCADAAPVAAPAGQVPDWTSVDERLPNGCYCLATYRDRAGKLRIIRAMYVRQFEIEATGDECDSETDEANDREYLKAGWYELIDNWGDYSSVHVCEGPVTHWMALPALPATQASTSGERQEGGAA